MVIYEMIYWIAVLAEILEMQYLLILGSTKSVVRAGRAGPDVKCSY